MRQPSRPRRIAFASLLGLAALTATATAQLPDWGVLPTSGSSSLQLEQSWVLAQSGKTVTAFSCNTRTWTSITTVNTPVITRYNDHFLVRDGVTYYGYSARLPGYAAQVTFSGDAELLPTPSPQTWHSVVLDGTRVHVFFALSGNWQTYAFDAPPQVVVGTLCVLIGDGTFVYGISTFHEGMVPLPMLGATILDAYGSSAFATSPGQLHGFSAHVNKWAHAPITTLPTLTTGHAQPGFVVVRDASSIRFFSGQTGTFTTIPASPTAQVLEHRQAALVLDGTTVHGYSGVRGEFATTTLNGPIDPHVSHFLGVVQDGQVTVAYSALRNAFSAPLPGSHQIVSGQVVAGASKDGAPVAVYSAYRNEWHPVPAITHPTMHVGGAAVVLTDPAGGLHGYSCRGDGWHFQASPPTSEVYMKNTPQGPSTTIVCRSGADLYAFNPRTERWRSYSIAGPPVGWNQHYDAFVAADGLQAHAYSILTDRWSTAPVPTAGSVATQVQSGYVYDGVVLQAYSGIGQVSTSAEFPEYWRVIAKGGKLRIDITGEPQSQAILLMSLGDAEIPVAPFGTLLLDPTTMFVLAQPGIPHAGIFHLSLVMPALAGLSGLEMFFQAAILGPQGFYLTNSAAATVY